MERPRFAMSLTRIVICLLGAALFPVAAVMDYPGGSNPPDTLRLVFVAGAILCLACVLYMEWMHGTLRALVRGRDADGPPLSVFRRKAEDLSRAAHAIADRLEDHPGSDRRQEYARDVAAQLRAALRAYDHAVFPARDRTAAADALRAVRDLVRAAGQASVKGDMGIDLGGHTAHFHDLATLYQEARYRDDRL